MPKILLGSGDATKFIGDAVVIPCDADLTYKKGNHLVQSLLMSPDLDMRHKKSTRIIRSLFDKVAAEGENKELYKELSAIGYCEIGNAVITKAYKHKQVKHIIFFPYTNHDNSEDKISTVLLHQALRSAFTLASLYELQTIAIPAIQIKDSKKEFWEEILGSFFSSNKNTLMTQGEMQSIIVAVSKEYNNTSLREIMIYR